MIVKFLLFHTIFSQHSIGDKKVGVQLFQWKFTDIKKECINFLGPNGYGFVQTSPIQAHINSYKEMFPDGGEYQWWLAYQPVSFDIGNRLGDEKEFKDMVVTCNSVNVKVITDVVINHFAHGDLNSTVGNFGKPTDWDSTSFNQKFPTANLYAEHFHDKLCTKYCDWAIDWEVYNCRLFGLVDLATEHPHVRNVIADFFNRLLVYGVYGFRIDAAKSIPHEDLVEILKLTNNNFEDSRPFVLYEFMYGYASGSGFKDYNDTGVILDFEYSRSVGLHFRNIHSRTTDTLINSISRGSFGNKIYSKTVDLLENHDKERDEDGEENYSLSSVNNGWWYNQSIIFNILYNRGIPIIHSGYKIYEKATKLSSETPLSAPYDKNGYILPINFGEDGECPEEWMCQHRWSSVYPLVKLRNEIETLKPNYILPEIQNLGYLSNQIYWGINGLYFAAINSKQGGDYNQDLDQYIQTGLPHGDYCNIMYSKNVNGDCVPNNRVSLNGEKLKYTVNKDGMTRVVINRGDFSRGVVLHHSPETMISTEKYVSMNVKIKHNAGFGNNLYLTGSMNSWDSCNSHRCVNMQEDDWRCDGIKLSQNNYYEWKIIKYNKDCKNPEWFGTSNEKTKTLYKDLQFYLEY